MKFCARHGYDIFGPAKKFKVLSVTNSANHKILSDIKSERNVSSSCVGGSRGTPESTTWP